jgi:hypothetical protein
LFAEYESTLNNPDIRDNLPAALKLSEEVESRLLEMEETLPCPENILEIDRGINLVDFFKKPETEGGFGCHNDWLDSENPIVESDERNEGLTEIDLSKSRLDAGWYRDELQDRYGNVPGEKRLKDLKKRDNIRLDFFVFASLWKLLKGSEEQKKEFGQKLTAIAEANSLKLDDLILKNIVFDGTILKSMNGDSYMMCLRRDIASGWEGGRCDIDDSYWNKYKPSLVLAS